jgi:hypothetical protein
METESKANGTLQGIIVGMTILAATWMIFNGILMIVDGTKQPTNSATSGSSQSLNKSLNITPSQSEATKTAPQSAIGSWSCKYGTALVARSGSVIKFDSSLEKSVGLTILNVVIDQNGAVKATHDDGSGFQGRLEGNTISADKKSFQISWNSNTEYYALSAIPRMVDEGAAHPLSLLCNNSN